MSEREATPEETRSVDESDLSRRRFLQGTGGVAAAAVLAGCLGGSDGAGQSGSNGSGGADSSTNRSGNASQGETQQPIQADRSKTLELVNATMTTLDPVAAEDAASSAVIGQLYEGLMAYSNGDLAVEPLLATNYRTSQDLRTYTFTLTDAQYHDGRTLGAQDFVYSFERLASSPNSVRSYFILDSLGVVHETTPDGAYKPGSLGIQAIDDKTLEITLQEPFHAALEMFAYSAFAATPQGIVGDVQGYRGRMPYDEFATQNPIGTGPFEFEMWQQGTEASVTRFENYHGGAASIAGIHWQIIEDDSALYEYFMNQNADYIIRFPTAQYDPDKVSTNRTDDLGRTFGTYGPLRNGLTANYVSVPLIDTFYIGFNMERVPKPVRQAMAYVSNQQLFVEQVFKARGEPAYHLTPPSIYPGGPDAYTQHAKQEYPYGYNESRLDEAKRVMKQAGYGQNDRFALSWLQPEDDAWNQMAQIIRDQLQSTYIDMNIQQAPFSTLLERTANGNAQAYALGWIADWPAPDNFLQLLNPPQTDTSRPAPINYTNWSPRTGSAAERAARAYRRIVNNLQPTQRAERIRDRAYVTTEEANWEDLSVIPIYHELGEGFWYDWVEIPPFGSVGQGRYDTVKIAHQRD